MPASATLTEAVRSEIASLGPMPFDRFMELALYDSAEGYYGSGRGAIGRHGDYMTSVSVGSLFGQLLAGQFEAMWTQLGEPPVFTLVEQGADSGDFAHDVLTAAVHASHGFWSALRYLIVEPFFANSERQRARLAEFDEKVAWHESITELPEFTGAHFSNELLDAMPVHLVAYRGGIWRERYVAQGGAGGEPPFSWTDGPLSSPALEAAVRQIPAVEGYETEINLAAPEWIKTLGARLQRGYVLVADYGFSRSDFFHPGRTRGTLSCYRKHQRSEDPLAFIGDQDITSHVEFTTLAESAERAGMELAGFTDQHHFMAALGKYVFPDTVGSMTPERQRTMRAFATLMHPSLMGRGFQFLALAKNAPRTVRGFELASEPRKALGLK